MMESLSSSPAKAPVFEVWGYVARMGLRLRPASDPFFADGDAVCQMRTSQYLTADEAEEELLHQDFPVRRGADDDGDVADVLDDGGPPSLACQVPGCEDRFSQLHEAEFHYASKHRHSCSVCRKSLPSAHLLELHLTENHDSYFQVLAARRPSYRCFLETCRADPFSSGADRRDHCIKDHQFPPDFRFENADFRKSAKKTGSSAKTKKKSAAKGKAGKVSKVAAMEEAATVLPDVPAAAAEAAEPRGSSSSSPSGVDPGPGSSIQMSSPDRRAPVSLARMGERLPSSLASRSSGKRNPNRHSVCVDASALHHESQGRRPQPADPCPPPSTPPPAAGLKTTCQQKKLLRRSCSPTYSPSTGRKSNRASEAPKASPAVVASPIFDPSSLRRRGSYSTSKSSIPLFIGQGSPRKASVGSKAPATAATSGSSATPDSAGNGHHLSFMSSMEEGPPSSRGDLLLSSGSSGGGPSPSEEDQADGPLAGIIDENQTTRSRIPVRKVPKNISFGAGAAKGFDRKKTISRNWYQQATVEGEKPSEKLALILDRDSSFAEDLRMVLDD